LESDAGAQEAINMDAAGDTIQEKLNYKARRWYSMAAVQYKEGNLQKSKFYLDNAWDCLYMLAEIDKTVKPQRFREPEFYFGRDDSGNQNFPDQPAPVPRQPSPDTKTASVALPIPVEGDAAQ